MNYKVLPVFHMCHYTYYINNLLILPSSFRQITLVCVEGTELPPIQKCTECCSRYHCPLCNSNIFKPTDRYRVIIHLKAHLARSVKYKGGYIFSIWHTICILFESVVNVFLSLFPQAIACTSATLVARHRLTFIVFVNLFFFRWQKVFWRRFV